MFRRNFLVARVLALIPARSGSKGFPNKNVAVVNGRSLIQHAISAAASASCIDEIYISTDSPVYEEHAMCSGAKSLGLRPTNLATDSARSIDVIQHFITRRGLSGEDTIVLLQPSSPVRTGTQIDQAVELHKISGESVVSVAELDEPNPYKLKIIDENNILQPLISGALSEIPRQELPISYQLTGGIYVSSCKNISEGNSLFSQKTLPFVVKEFCNIDSKQDFEFLEFRVQRGLLW